MSWGINAEVEGLQIDPKDVEVMLQLKQSKPRTVEVWALFEISWSSWVTTH